MENKIIKITLDDGNSLEFKEKSIEHFRKHSTSENAAKDQYYNQYLKWETNVLSCFNMSIKEFAKKEYDLIDSDERKDINDFDDDDILSEAEFRGILPVSTELQNENIMNEDFVERFVNIVNRGNSQDIESALEYLEFKFKI